MIQNRTIPYGYKMINGAICLDVYEASIVKEVYTLSADGYSYMKIADSLTDKGVKYIKSKPTWNKNMVARMLQNKTYLGTEKYPRIIDDEIFISLQSNNRIVAKPCCETLVALKPKLRCGICGGGVLRHKMKSGRERWHCANDTSHISHRLTDETLITEIKSSLSTTGLPTTTECESVEISKLANEIEREISDGINIEDIVAKMKQLVSLKYSSLPMPKMMDLSYEALHLHVDYIEVTDDSVIKIQTLF